MSIPLELEFHSRLGAIWDRANNIPLVVNYREIYDEYRFLIEGCGVLDMSARGRICIVGKDRVGFLHGQVTNDVKALKAGQGCYAALLNVKGKMESDLNIWMLENEILLDFEPGLTAKLIERLNRYIIAEDVEVEDVSKVYAHITLCGPRCGEVLSALSPAIRLPPSNARIQAIHASHEHLGEAYISTHLMGNTFLHSLFVPVEHHVPLLESIQEIIQARQAGGWVGQRAFQTLRTELGVPRFGVEMDSTHLPPEAGLEAAAISYSKGCYIGQEIIARMRTYGQASKRLCGFVLSDEMLGLPGKGTPIWCGEKKAGNLVSAVHSLAMNIPIAMGYLKKQYLDDDSVFELRTEEGDFPIKRVPLPF